jgi:hypothetical protein
VVTCWGSQLYESPCRRGRFKEVAGTDEMICGIRDSGAISCWGPTVTSSELSPTAPPLHKIFAGYDGEVCGLDAGGVPRCPVYSGSKAPPRGPFESLALGASPTVLSNAIRCGLRPDGTVVCWGDSPLVARIPAGSYRQVVVGEGLVCLLDVGGQVKCWGERSSIEAYGEIPVPAGKYQQLSAGNVHVCALRADRSLACWSTDGSWDNHPPPKGTFVESLRGERPHAPSTRTGETLCWGPMAPPGPVPTGLRQIGTANRQGYGLTEKGEIADLGEPIPQVPAAGALPEPGRRQGPLRSETRRRAGLPRQPGGEATARAEPQIAC